jgi:site-specific DNA-cytosine methylase
MGGVRAAYDISEVSNAVYSHNFGDSPIVQELATVNAREIISLGANAWLMSPPCQPFCRMGGTGGLEDARSAAFLRLMDLLTEIRPEHFVLENVEGFLESDAHALLLRRLDEAGLEWRSIILCPTQFGIPNRRPRVYVVASVNGVLEGTAPSIEPIALGNYLDPGADGDESLYLTDEEATRHGPGLDMVGPESKRSACFIGGYGKRFVGSGSFLKTSKGIRRFSPMEISRLMGYPPNFSFPDGVPLVKQYKLLGNGLNIEVARWVIGQLTMMDAANGRAD